MVSHSNKIISIIIGIMIYFSSNLLFIVYADDTVENNIDAVFNIEFISGTELNVNIISNVEKINLIATETSYSKDEIISIYENNSEIMGAIKYVLKNSKILDIEYKIISFKEMIGKTMDEIATLKKNDNIGYCSYCGVFRRLCLNYISNKRYNIPN